MLSKEDLKQLLLSRNNLKYDLHMGLLVESAGNKRTWLVPFGLANRSWPASPDSPVMLEQTLSDGVWYNNKAWRLRDNLPIEPPFPPSGHCWVIINTADPLKDGDICYAFSCYDTARSAADSAPQHLSGQLAVEEALTYTPWAAPYKPHTVRPFSKDLYHED